MTRQDAIRIVGSVQKLTELLDVSRQAVYAWKQPLSLRIKQRIYGALAMEKTRNEKNVCDAEKHEVRMVRKKRLKFS